MSSCLVFERTLTGLNFALRMIYANHPQFHQLTCNIIALRLHAFGPTTEPRLSLLPFFSSFLFVGMFALTLFVQIRLYDLALFSSFSWLVEGSSCIAKLSRVNKLF